MNSLSGSVPALNWPYGSLVAQYLLVIGDREALGWLLTSQRMAFRDVKRPEVRALTAGDKLFLYTTRGCFGNPTRDRGRVIGSGVARSAAVELDQPVEVAGRSFPVGCSVEFKMATAWPNGVEMAPLVPELDLFHGVGQHWSFRIRRPLVALTDRDARKISRLLVRQRLHPLEDVIDIYAHWWMHSGK